MSVADTPKLPALDRHSPDAGSLQTFRDAIPALDGIRAVAVLLVLWAHLPPGVWTVYKALVMVCQPAYLGVDLFFVLSGFLITRILLHDKATCRPLRNFLIRRALRIFPIYYLTLAVVLLWRPSWDIAWCATYLSNFRFSFDMTPGPLRHTWSLCVEEHFYLLWPVLVSFAPLRLSHRIAVFVIVPGAILLAIAAIMADGRLPAADLIYRASPFRALSLTCGALLAFHEGDLRRRPDLRLRLALILCVAGSLMVLCCKWTAGQWYAVGKMAGVAAFASGVICWAIPNERDGGWPRRLPAAKPMRAIGRISYGLYLYHYPIYFALGVPGSGGWTGAAALGASIAVVATFLVAYLSYLFLERPILRFQEQFR